MPRLMSVSLTEAAVIARTKTVTRRLGWRMLKPGDRLTLCRKVMGRRNGEPLVRLAEVEVVSVRREPVRDITDDDIAREGVPATLYETLAALYGWPKRVGWAQWFCDQMGCQLTDEVTRIEWRYLDDPESAR